MQKNSSSATKTSLTEKRKTERRLGLLATAAGQQQESGRCLTHEEMALLLESGDISIPEHQTLYSHLTTCEQCYQQWFILSSENRKSGIKITKLFTHPRYMAVTGSALAIAASIIVFINIPQKQIIQTEQPPVTSLSTSAEETENFNEVETAPGLQAQNEAVLEKNSRVSKKAMIPAIPAPVTEQQDTALGSSIQPDGYKQAGSGHAPAEELYQTDTFLSYTKKLDSYCQQPAFEPEQAQALIKNGKDLQATNSTLSDHQKTDLNTILMTISAMSEENFKQTCLEIDKILKE